MCYPFLFLKRNLMYIKPSLMRKHYKKILIIIVLFSAVVLCPTLFDRRAEIVFTDGKRYDFGYVQQGKLIKHSFIFENRGNKTLKIKNVKTSCGCTDANIPKKIIKPGEKSKIIIRYIGRPTHGEEILSAWFQTNDPKTPLAQVLLTGRVRLKVFWYPQTVTFYGQKSNNMHYKDVQFLSSTYEEFKAISINVSNPYIIAKCRQNKKGVLCRIKLGQNYPAGNSSEYVDIKFDLGGEAKTVYIPVIIMLH